jgi:hemoglobin
LGSVRGLFLQQKPVFDRGLCRSRQSGDQEQPAGCLSAAEGRPAKEQCDEKPAYHLCSASSSVRVPVHAEDILFADMGGRAGIDKFVDASVDNYPATDRIKAIFDESIIDRLRTEFKVRFCKVAGGPCEYIGHDMAAAHKGVHLTNTNVNAVVEDLQDAMDKVGLLSRPRTASWRT